MANELENSDDDITTEQFRNPNTWENLRAVLREHPNPITRHEACFIAGELKLESLIPDLQEATIRDPSLVVRHEAIEALGRMVGQDVHAIDTFLASLLNLRKDALLKHPDIIATLETARRRLAKTINAPQNMS